MHVLPYLMAMYSHDYVLIQVMNWFFIMVYKKFSLEKYQIDFSRKFLFSGDIFHQVFFQFHQPLNILVQWLHAFTVMTVCLYPDNIAHSHNTPWIHCVFWRRRIVPQENPLFSQVLLNASHEPSPFKCIDCDPKIQLVIEVQEITVRKPSRLRYWESVSD